MLVMMPVVAVVFTGDERAHGESRIGNHNIFHSKVCIHPPFSSTITSTSSSTPIATFACALPTSTFISTVSPSHSAYSVYLTYPLNSLTDVRPLNPQIGSLVHPRTKPTTHTSHTSHHPAIPPSLLLTPSPSPSRRLQWSSPIRFHVPAPPSPHHHNIAPPPPTHTR